MIARQIYHLLMYIAFNIRKVYCACGYRLTYKKEKLTCDSCCKSVGASFEEKLHI